MGTREACEVSSASGKAAWPAGLVRKVECHEDHRSYLGVMSRITGALGAVGMAFALIAPVAPAEAATYHVRVTCSVPKSQPERQLAPNSCLNYLPDGTQTFTARVTNSNGVAVAGVKVQWSDSSSTAQFRLSNNPCTTGTNGKCSDELVETRPRHGEKITVTATVGGSSGVGYLTFK